jgi:hypothetical protein
VSAFSAATDFKDKLVIDLGTGTSRMTGFVDAMQKQVVNGKFIRKDEFYDIGKTALAEQSNSGSLADK